MCVVRCWLSVACRVFFPGCGLLCVVCRVFGVRWLLFVVCCVLLCSVRVACLLFGSALRVVCCLSAVRCSLFVVCCLYCVAWCLSLFVVRCRLLGVRCLLFVVGLALVGVCCSLLAVC